MGFARSGKDPCVYFKENIVVGVFVDDMLIIGELPDVTEFKK